MDELLASLQASPIATSMRSSLWLYPIVEIVHITGFVLLVGPVLMFDLRVLGWGRALALVPLGRYLLPCSVAGLALVVPAGLLMFSTQPQEFASNPVFQLKLLLIAAAGLNAGLFHLTVYRRAAQWPSDQPAPARARVQALASLLIWLAVICCGRLLAYT